MHFEDEQASSFFCSCKAASPSPPKLQTNTLILLESSTASLARYRLPRDLFILTCSSKEMHPVGQTPGEPGPRPLPRTPRLRKVEAFLVAPVPAPSHPRSPRLSFQGIGIMIYVPPGL